MKLRLDLANFKLDDGTEAAICRNGFPWALLVASSIDVRLTMSVI